MNDIKQPPDMDQSCNSSSGGLKKLLETVEQRIVLLDNVCSQFKEASRQYLI